MPAGALSAVLPLFVMLALGALCRRTRLFPKEGAAALKALAVNVALPAVMFSAFATADVSARGALVPCVMLALCAVALALGLLLCRLFRVPGRLSPYLCTGFEAGMLGYALFALGFPEVDASRFALIDLGQVLFVFTVYKAMLAGKGGARGALREAARSPVVWAILAGLLAGVFDLYGKLDALGLGGVLEGVVAFVAAPTGALILIGIGYELTPRAMNLKRVAPLIALRYGLMALLLCLTLFVNRALLAGAMHEGALTLMFLLPPPFVLPVFAQDPEERAGIASALSAMTLISVALFAALIGLAFPR